MSLLNFSVHFQLGRDKNLSARPASINTRFSCFFIYLFNRIKTNNCDADVSCHTLNFTGQTFRKNNNSLTLLCFCDSLTYKPIRSVCGRDIDSITLAVNVPWFKLCNTSGSVGFTFQYATVGDSFISNKYNIYSLGIPDAALPNSLM